MEEKKPSGMFAVFAALGANVLVAISKFIGFGLSGSAAMLNESIHSGWIVEIKFYFYLVTVGQNKQVQICINLVRHVRNISLV